MKRRLPTEKEAIPVAVSGIVQKYNTKLEEIKNS